MISLKNIGKRYNYEWIFRNVNYEFTSGNSYVISGANGSGKSTLLQLISGSTTSSEGLIEYNISTANHELKTTNISQDIYKSVSMSTPALELYEEYTLKEAVVFHSRFKPFFKDIDINKIIELTELEKSKDKELKYFSSGMKQRVKLALAILSDTPILLLDEPASNLDKNAIQWYQNLIKQYTANRLVIVCSNQHQHEYEFCNKQLQIEDYK